MIRMSGTVAPILESLLDVYRNKLIIIIIIIIIVVVVVVVRVMVAGLVTSFVVEDSGSEFQRGQEMFIFFETPRWILRPTQPPFQ